jgi:hypothetical protein
MVGLTKSNGATMTNFKTLSAIVVLSAAVAAPVFAQDASVAAPRHARVHNQSDYRGSYNQINTNGAPFDAAPRTPEEIRNLENFGFSGRDPSRVGGESPNLNPPS